MNINVTLIGQAIAFAIFVWVCMRYIWPPITGALEERKRKIAEGLEAGVEGERLLEQARAEAEHIVSEARDTSRLRISEADKRAQSMVEDAKVQAREEASRIVEQGQSDAERAYRQASDALRAEAVEIAIKGAEVILREELGGDKATAYATKLQS